MSIWDAAHQYKLLHLLSTRHTELRSLLGTLFRPADKSLLEALTVAGRTDSYEEATAHLHVWLSIQSQADGDPVDVDTIWPLWEKLLQPKRASQHSQASQPKNEGSLASPLASWEGLVHPLLAPEASAPDQESALLDAPAHPLLESADAPTFSLLPDTQETPPTDDPFGRFARNLPKQAAATPTSFVAPAPPLPKSPPDNSALAMPGPETQFTVLPTLPAALELLGAPEVEASAPPISTSVTSVPPTSDVPEAEPVTPEAELVAPKAEPVMPEAPKRPVMTAQGEALLPTSELPNPNLATEIRVALLYLLRITPISLWIDSTALAPFLKHELPQSISQSRVDLAPLQARLLCASGVPPDAVEMLLDELQRYELSQPVTFSFGEDVVSGEG